MKKIAIIFPDKHLAYSPTTLNVFSYLKQTNKVKILAFDLSHKPSDTDVIEFKGGTVVFRIVNFLLRSFFFINKYDERYLIWQKVRVVLHLFFRRYNEIIAVDLKSVWFVSGYTSKRIHLLSLELTDNTINFKSRINFDDLSSIIIQNEDRLNFLTAEITYRGEVFYLQNAPATILKKPNEQPNQNKLLYVGTARFQFGIKHCLSFIEAYKDYELTIHGYVEDPVLNLIKDKHADLLRTERLKLSNSYLNELELIELVSNHRIGFCFYDFSYPEINNFNYLSAPSGKMFTYFAAGIPVVGSDIPGLNPITKFNAGKQIARYEPKDIKMAIDEINKNYDNYRENSLEAAKMFDFKEGIKPFLNYIYS